MEALMLSLLVWIGANSDFKIPENQSAHPKIEYVTRDALNRKIFGVIGSAKKNADTVNAWYDDRANKIYLAKDFNPAKLEDRRTIVHELVHFLQTHNKIKYECLNPKEREAYKIASLWGMEKGITDDYSIYWIYGPRGCVSEMPPDFYP